MDGLIDWKMAALSLWLKEAEATLKAQLLATQSELEATKVGG